MELGSLVFDEEDLPSLPGLRVRNIRPFFSGDGVRGFASSVGPSDSIDVPELFRGAIAGR
jgi:hypothetical protein